MSYFLFIPAENDGNELYGSHDLVYYGTVGCSTITWCIMMVP